MTRRNNFVKSDVVKYLIYDEKSPFTFKNIAKKSLSKIYIRDKMFCNFIYDKENLKFVNKSEILKYPQKYLNISTNFEIFNLHWKRQYYNKSDTGYNPEVCPITSGTQCGCGLIFESITNAESHIKKVHGNKGVLKTYSMVWK
jgi:hypothetical protein